MVFDVRSFDVPMFPNEDNINIPRSFYRLWGHELDNEVMFIDPNGNRFEVSIESINLDMWFNCGILAIRNFYGIVGFVLFSFRYIGLNQFYIRIRDGYLMDLQYPEQMPYEIIDLISSDDDEDIDDSSGTAFSLGDGVGDEVMDSNEDQFEVALLSREDSIKIPESFSQKWGPEARDVVEFIDPVNKKFMIRITNVGGLLYFSEGMESMRSFYKIDGDVLFSLSYIGNRLFNIRIRNSEMSEIDYCNGGDLDTDDLSLDSDLDSSGSVNPTGDESYQLLWLVKLTKAQVEGR